MPDCRTSSRLFQWEKLVALGLLLISLPGLILISILLLPEQRGAIFYVENRKGLHGKIFRILKFRTMRGGDITPVGGWLRRLSLDELPQLINVLKGEMSLVGPRPHTLSLDQRFAHFTHLEGRYRVTIQ